MIDEGNSSFVPTTDCAVALMSLLELHGDQGAIEGNDTAATFCLHTERHSERPRDGSFFKDLYIMALCKHPWELRVQPCFTAVNQLPRI